MQQRHFIVMRRDMDPVGDTPMAVRKTLTDAELVMGRLCARDAERTNELRAEMFSSGESFGEKVMPSHFQHKYSILVLTEEA